MMCRKQRTVRSQGHQHYLCATAFNECVSGGQLFRLGGQWASDAFPQLSHARFKQIHPQDTCRKPPPEVSRKRRVSRCRRDVGNTLMVVRRHARRQATAGRDKFGRLRCHPQLVEVSRLLCERQPRPGKDEAVLLPVLLSLTVKLSRIDSAIATCPSGTPASFEKRRNKITGRLRRRETLLTPIHRGRARCEPR